MDKLLEIYLDYNVIIDLMDLKKSNNDLYNQIFQKLKKYKIFYSYAHTEEIVFSFLSKDDIDERLEILREISQNNLINYSFIKEKRDVLEKYEDSKGTEDFNLNLLSALFFKEENREIFSLNEKGKFNNEQKFEELVFKNYENFEKFIIVNITDDNIMSHKNYKLAILYLRDFFILPDYESFNKIKIQEIMKQLLNDFQFTVAFFEILFEFLYSINFYKDRSKNPYKSKVFDVTHAIFASKTDIFFTTDNGFFQKIKILYDFLGISTKIFLVKQYCQPKKSKVNNKKEKKEFLHEYL